MTDEFDEAIASALNQGTEPTIRDVLEVMRSAHRVTLQCYGENKQAIADNSTQLRRIASHLESETRQREKVEERLTELEAAHATCADRIVGIIEPIVEKQSNAHFRFHTEHLDKDHGAWRAGMPDRRQSEMTETEWQGRFLWGTGSRFVNVGFVVLGGVIIVIINLIVYGRP